jgi:hypothetical protein
MMACLFWDPRGLGEDRKVNFIGNAIHDHNMFLLGIDEYKKSSFSGRESERIGG